MAIGIEAINVYGGRACIDVRELFSARGLDAARFENLMMSRKAVAFPWEDAVTNAVNAARPLVTDLTEQERKRIELLVVGTESGVDFGKSISTYIHAHLGLDRRCRLFEVKQACYGGTAALQTAVSYIASGVSPGAKALVIATDEARAGGKNSYHEPSQGVGAAAMLIGEDARVLQVDLGASGFCSYEVMDTCRPQPGLEAGDPDVSLLAYLDCLESSYRDYAERVEDCDFLQTFDYLVFHTPFAGMVKGAHRKMAQRFGPPGHSRAAIEADFDRRVRPSLTHCVEVGNVYSATLFLALCGLLETARPAAMARVGLFSYGSGCSSEFFSGTFDAGAAALVRRFRIGEMLAERHLFKIEELDRLLEQTPMPGFGVENLEVSPGVFSPLYDRYFAGRGSLVLVGVKNFHREYQWA